MTDPAERPRVDHAAAGEVMGRLPDVEWDRFTEGPGFLKVYGWLDQDCEACGGRLEEAPHGTGIYGCSGCGGSGKDRRRDFVVLEFEQGAVLGVSVTTSSAEHSKAITAVIYGIEAPHIDCERVEHDPVLAQVENVSRSIVIP